MSSLKAFSLAIIAAAAISTMVWLLSGLNADLSEKQLPSARIPESTERPTSASFPPTASSNSAGGAGSFTIPALGNTQVIVTPLPSDSEKEIIAFREWAERYLAASPDERTNMVAEGQQLAQAHRVALKTMISTDPRSVLEQAVPMVLRQRLPSGIVSLLEERLSGRGTFDVLAVTEDRDPSTPPISRVAKLKGRYFKAYTFGQRSAQMSTENAMLNGVAVDNLFAVSESPVRPLEVGEIPDPARQAVETCPVSQITTKIEREPGQSPPAITPETPAIEAGEEIIYLCDGGHIRQIEFEQLAAEGATGSPTSPTGPFPVGRQFSTGIRKILYMRVMFPDRMEEAQTERDANNNIRTLTDYFQEGSYGKLTFMGAVTPSIVLPRTAAWYIEDFKTAGASYAMLDDAKEIARGMGYTPEEYNHHVVIYFGGPGNFGGQGSVNGAYTWLKSTGVGVFQHEIGHNIGVWHSNSWNTTGASTIGPGKNAEYGHTNDVMGSSGSGGHFNASMKEQLQWLLPEDYHSVTQSGTYRLYQFDQVNQDNTRRYALKVAKDADRDYWLEFRQKLTTNPWYSNGVSINWSPWGHGSGGNNDTEWGSNRGTQLLDMTPGTADDRTDSPLTIGRTFSDNEADLHITPIQKNNTIPPSIDVVVNRGTAAAGNQPPTLSITVPNLNPGIGTIQTFQATATDPDNDTLAYFWDMGDKLTSFNGSAFSTDNSATQSKFYSAAGHYTVRCTVSDMKGGTTTQTLRIQVGSPATFTASGTIMFNGSPAPNVRVHNGQTTANYRGTLTDSNGYYQITNLSSGTVTLSASLLGYTFSPSFTNPITLTSSQSNLNFTSVASNLVSISASDPSATEGGDTGTFTITRSGDTTNPLTVYVDFSGNAATADYSLNPTATTTSAPLEIFVIPAGSASLDIVATPTNDTAQEGPEAVVMSLINGSASYIPSGPQTVSIVINDNDTTKSLLSMETLDPDATEDNPADTASLVIRRSGSTAGDLTVKYTFASASGHATSGTDYTIPATLVIPDGQSSATLTIIPVNDSLVEGTELIAVTLAVDTAYILPSSAPAATMKILDDEIPAITIAATDATANENGNTGTFTITRTGNLSAGLVVHYSISGTAIHGTDYAALPGFVNFAPGASQATVFIIPHQDNHGEPAQEVTLQLRSSSAYAIASPSKASVSIADDGDLPVVAIGVSDGTASEATAPGTGKFKITTTGTVTGNITINYTISGTASSGQDFTAISSSVSMGGNTTTEIIITPIDDLIPENAETLLLTLQPSSSYALDLQNSATMVITDDDSINMVSVSTAVPNITEGGTAKFYISRPTTTSSALTVRYAVAGSATAGDDYTALSGTATIPASGLGVFIDVVTINDTLAEGTEHVVMTILPDSDDAVPDYGIQSGTATLPIFDNDAGFASVISFTTTSSTSDESAATIQLSVTRTSPTAACSVEYGVRSGTANGGGVDFLLPPGVLNFAAGEATKTIPLTLVDDVVSEDLETIIIQLRNANGASIATLSSQLTMFVRDNEPRIIIEPTDPFAYEGSADNATLTFRKQGSLNSAVVIPITISGTAVSGADYTALPSTVTIPKDVSSATLTISGIADAIAEAAETIVVSLLQSSSAATQPDQTVTVMLGDLQTDDPPFVKIVSPKGVAPGVPTNMGLRLDALYADDRVQSETLALAWSKVSGPGTVTFTTPGQGSSGTTFSTAGIYTLRFSVTDAAQTGSANITVTVGSAVSPWINANIGSLSLSGAGSLYRDTHAISGTGTSLGGTADSLFFRHRTFTGDGEIIARVRYMQSTATSARVGIMFREDSTAGSKMATVLLAPAAGNVAYLQNRTAANTTAATTSSLGLTPGYWLRLTRAGSTFTAYHSPDGNLWTPLGSPQVNLMNSQLLVGIAANSASSTLLNSAIIDNVRITGIPENNGPSLQFAAVPTTSVNSARGIDGTLTEDSLPSSPGLVSYQWSQVSGPGTAVFTNPTVLDATVTMPAVGNYVFQLNADDGEVETYRQVSASATQPAVTITLTMGTASELGQQQGMFTISRSGGNTAPLTVKTTRAGSAISGTDYVALPSDFTIPAGSATVAVYVSPIRDHLAEGPESVSVALQADPAYSINTPSSASLFIADMPFDQWRLDKFGNTTAANNASIADPMADYDHDGISTVFEYALNLDPQTAEVSGQPIFSIEGNTCSLSYRRVLAAIDVTYQAQFSTTLASEGWSSDGITTQVIANDGIVQTIKATKTFTAPPERSFMRLKVTRH